MQRDKLSFTAASVVTFLSVLVPVGAGAAEEWVRHKDPAGFEISTPRGGPCHLQPTG